MVDKIIQKIKTKIIILKTRKEGGYAFSTTIRKHYLNRYNIKIGYGTYGGCFSPANIPPGTEFGNYCSIAGEIKIFRANHPSDYFTLHPLFYNPSMGYVKKDMLTRPKIKIGHDVWIGSRTIILPSVTEIGNGVIIGAGSIVTKNIPPYSIAVGNPAKVIKKRFTQEIIDKLEKAQWWNLNREELINKRPELEKITHEQE